MAVSEDAPAHAAQAAPPAPAGDPAMIGVPTFVVGSIALGLTLVGYVPADAVGAPVAIILAATGIGQVISAAWAASLGQNAVAAIFGVFAGFWISYGLLVLGLTHEWFGAPTTKAATGTQALFLLSWLVLIVVLTLVSLRLPAAFTLLFVLVDVALLLVLLGTVNGAPNLAQIGGYVVLLFALLGAYLFANAMSAATGGKGLPLGGPLVKG